MPEPERIDRRRAALIAYDVCRRALAPSDPARRAAMRPVLDAWVRMIAAARAAGVPVNVIDRPAFCDFAFGAIVNRSPLVIGVSTDGAAPVFAQAIRARLETLIPHGFARWAEAAARWRPHVQALGRGFAARFWEKFAARAMARARRRQQFRLPGRRRACARHDYAPSVELEKHRQPRERGDARGRRVRTDQRQRHGELNRHRPGSGRPS